MNALNLEVNVATAGIGKNAPDSMTAVWPGTTNGWAGVSFRQLRTCLRLDPGQRWATALNRCAIARCAGPAAGTVTN
jgi:hypothetical protein